MPPLTDSSSDGGFQTVDNTSNDGSSVYSYSGGKSSESEHSSGNHTTDGISGSIIGVDHFSGGADRFSGFRYSCPRGPFAELLELEYDDDGGFRWKTELKTNNYHAEMDEPVYDVSGSRTSVPTQEDDQYHISKDDVEELLKWQARTTN